MADTIRVTYRAETASGNRKGWGKWITGVADNGERGAKRFTGEYLESGFEVDLPVGAIILETVPTGSARHGGTDARFLRVDPEVEGGFEALPGEWDWRKQFLSVVDRAKALLAEPEAETQPSDRLLSTYTTAELRAELERREAAGEP